MAENANPPLRLPEGVIGATPIEARKAAIRTTRERMSGDLNVLEQKVRAAVGVRDDSVASPPGQRRAVKVVTLALTVRRLWALPFWRLTAVGVATAGLVALGVWRSRRDAGATIPISPS